MQKVTLELVEVAFCEWRAQRSSRAESIPENLWTMAVGLYPQYKRSKICHRLRLSGSQFKRRIQGEIDPLAENGFVLASREEIKARPELIPEVRLTIQGKERALTLCVEMHALGHILPQLGMLL
ncbi:hypothetical protein [Legionella longbeachae]|uniref:hypothetical protein n=1 Tax=Legionella longbeachae TaxID=450 RepID=UPI00399D4E3A